jgi:hypothetical protein
LASVRAKFQPGRKTNLTSFKRLARNSVVQALSAALHGFTVRAGLLANAVVSEALFDMYAKAG